jgi:hypothetical protein
MLENLCTSFRHWLFEGTRRGCLSFASFEGGALHRAPPSSLDGWLRFARSATDARRHATSKIVQADR